ncbi:MAG TPA: zinc ribbon domain-containing protein [Candidatus Eremiobacteraeota bacterium]|nr:MAG: hypothetical protein BWY64_03304 [bacterium ADurb.Bin363]HPZ07289.1 zinc ribbon domain-containing protein [Candidatus Eremiobacteraeota bacterium]
MKDLTLSENSKIIPRPLKFDYLTDRENCFHCLGCIGFLLIPVSLFFDLGIVYIGIAIAVVFWFLSAFTDDYLILNEEEKMVYLHRNFFFFKSVKQCLPHNIIKSVNVETLLRTEIFTRYEGIREVKDTKTYIDLSLKLVLTNIITATLITNKEISIYEDGKYQSNEEVRELINLAMEIATMAECDLLYADEIPEKERLLPVSGKKSTKQLKREIIQSNLIKEEKPLEEMQHYNPEEKIQSDFIDYEKIEGERKCPSCGIMVSMENKFCTDCGREL